MIVAEFFGKEKSRGPHQEPILLFHCGFVLFDFNQTQRSCWRHPRLRLDPSFLRMDRLLLLRPQRIRVTRSQRIRVTELWKH